MRPPPPNARATDEKRGQEVAAARDGDRRMQRAKRSRRRVPDKRRLIARDPRGFFSMKETCEITSLSRSTIDRLVEVNMFPEKVPLTGNPRGRKGFRVFEVLQWMANRG